MNNRALVESASFINERFGEKKGNEVIELAVKRMEQLRGENISDSKAVKAHTEKEIFPCISLYESLKQSGIPAEEALDFLDKIWSIRAEPGASKIKNIIKFAGIYKLYPAIFKFVAKKNFGTKAGFRAKFYECGKYRCKFDMKKCIYFDTCKRYGCPELTKCFCHVDDVNNGDLHPRLCWNRTQFMGEGAEFCDFDIFVREKENLKK